MIIISKMCLFGQNQIKIYLIYLSFYPLSKPFLIELQHFSHFQHMIISILSPSYSLPHFPFHNNHSKIKSMTLPLLLTSNLSHIYPDISEQLCNRHGKLLSELKNRFCDLYDGFEPQKYVIVNGIAKVIDLGRGLQANFALQNGVTVLYSRTYPNEDIFLNGNHLEEELIFNSRGKHTEGIHQKGDQIRDLLFGIRGRAQKGKQFLGGIFYVHSNIGEQFFAAQESFMLAVFIGLLQLHQETANYSRSDIVSALTQADPSLSKESLSHLLEEFQINQCRIEMSNNGVSVQSDSELEIVLCDPQSDKSIKTHESNQSIRIGEQKSFKSTAKDIQRHPSQSTQSNDSIGTLAEEQPDMVTSTITLDPARKLILCRMDLSQEEHLSYQRKLFRARELVQQQRIGCDLLQEVDLQDRELIHYCEEIQSLVNALSTKKIDFCEFITRKHELDVKYQLFEQEVVALIGQIRQEAPFLKNFCLLQGSVLLISADKLQYPEVVRFLRRLFNDYKLSTCRFLQTHRRLQQQKQCEIGEIMFTTSPSLGCAIYDPTGNCWL